MQSWNKFRKKNQCHLFTQQLVFLAASATFCLLFSNKYGVITSFSVSSWSVSFYPFPYWVDKEAPNQGVERDRWSSHLSRIWNKRFLTSSRNGPQTASMVHQKHQSQVKPSIWLAALQLTMTGWFQVSWDHHSHISLKGSSLQNMIVHVVWELLVQVQVVLVLPKHFWDYFIKNSSIHEHFTRSCNKIHIPYARTGVRMQQLRTCGPKLWNFIDPTIIANSQSWACI